MSIKVGRVLKDSGANARQLMTMTGIEGRSLYRHAQAASIDLMYRQNGGPSGIFGLPLGDVEFEGNTAIRDFAGSGIRILSNGEAQGGNPVTVVNVRFVGFRCLKESTWDQASSSDEPYFIIGVAGTNGSHTVKFGPYGDIDTGSVRYEATDVLSKDLNVTPPIALVTVAMENDFGTPDEATQKVRDAVVQLEKKVDEAAAAFMGVPTDSHVMPEWMRDIVIGWGPEFLANLLGMGDDEVGRLPVILFDYKPEGGEWEQPPVLGKHGPNDYTHTYTIDGGSEGKYDVFFHVRLFTSTPPQVQPYPPDPQNPHNP